MRKLLVALALLGTVVASSGCLGTGTLVGEPAPPFTVVTNEGRVVNETTHLGKFVVLDLMATWCGPCVLEVAHLREIQQRYGDRVEILSVGVDPTFDSLESLGEFAEQHDATWPHAVDDGRKLAQAYKLGIIPKLVIIDPQGVVVLEEQGEVLPAAMARVIDPAGAPADAPSALLPAGAAAAVGFLAAFNPYRRFHRELAGRAPYVGAAAILALAGLAAWLFSAFVSSRATYGSLFLGALTIGALAWWLRARRKDATAHQGTALAAASDRAYEAAPHFAFALVLGLQGSGAVAYALPLAAFLAAAALGAHARPRVPEANRTALGLLGLALAGGGLLVFGARILVAYAG